MGRKYRTLSLAAIESEEAKPGRRWEVSPQFEIGAYNYNVAHLESDERLSQNAYHYHEAQAELFHVIDGRCRVETDQESFDLAVDELVYFVAGVAHLLHNPFETACKLVAVGHPPEARYPVHQIKSYDELLAERYLDGVGTEPREASDDGRSNASRQVPDHGEADGNG